MIKVLHIPTGQYLYFISPTQNLTIDLTQAVCYNMWKSSADWKQHIFDRIVSGASGELGLTGKQACSIVKYTEELELIYD